MIQYEPTYLNWTREGIGHSTLLLDHRSPEGGPFTTREVEEVRRLLREQRGP